VDPGFNFLQYPFPHYSIEECLQWLQHGPGAVISQHSKIATIAAIASIAAQDLVVLITCDFFTTASFPSHKTS
jgi:hypothetical protein